MKFILFNTLINWNQFDLEEIISLHFINDANFRPIETIRVTLLSIYNTKPRQVSLTFSIINHIKLHTQTSQNPTRTNHQPIPHNSILVRLVHPHHCHHSKLLTTPPAKRKNRTHLATSARERATNEPTRRARKGLYHAKEHRTYSRRAQPTRAQKACLAPFIIALVKLGRSSPARERSNAVRKFDDDSSGGGIGESRGIRSGCS